MTEIQVVFPKSGNLIVANEIEGALNEELLSWHVRSENPAIQKVHLEFQGQSAGFFEGRSEITKALTYWSREPVVGDTIIHGRAPKGDREGVLTFKYTVRGLDGKGKTVTEQDPQILVITI